MDLLVPASIVHPLLPTVQHVRASAVHRLLMDLPVDVPDVLRHMDLPADVLDAPQLMDLLVDAPGAECKQVKGYFLHVPNKMFLELGIHQQERFTTRQYSCQFQKG